MLIVLTVVSSVADPNPVPSDPIFLGLLDPDPLIRGMDLDSDPSIIKQKIVRKSLIPTVLLLLFNFLSLKNYVYVPSKSNKQENFNKKRFFVGLLKVNDEN
jgi:hypothetical protein